MAEAAEAVVEQTDQVAEKMTDLVDEAPKEETTEPEEINHVAQESTEPKTEEKVERPEGLPDKFWDEKKGTDIQGLSKAYAELEKKFHNGDHKAPKEYDLSALGENIPEGDTLLEGYKEWAKENGISQAAFDTLATTFANEFGYQEQEQRDLIKSVHEQLGPNSKEIIRSNIDWSESLQRKGVIDQTEFEALNELGATAAGQRLMMKLRERNGEMAKIPVNADVSDLKTKDELQEMVNNPEYRNNPAFRAKVEREFERSFGTI